jgi:hypothetical protein
MHDQYAQALKTHSQKHLQGDFGQTICRMRYHIGHYKHKIHRYNNIQYDKLNLIFLIN